MEFDLVVKAVITEDSNILIIKRSLQAKHNPGGITFPGGHVERNETLSEAVCREVLEETGLVVEPKKILSISHFQGKEGNVEIVSIKIWCVDTKQKSLKLNEELHSAELVPIDSIDESYGESVTKTIAELKKLKTLKNNF